MPRFKSRTKHVQAILWTGKNHQAVVEFLSQLAGPSHAWDIASSGRFSYRNIHSGLSSYDEIAAPGDWIILKQMEWPGATDKDFVLATSTAEDFERDYELCE